MLFHLPGEYVHFYEKIPNVWCLKSGAELGLEILARFCLSIF